jgi:predicted PolB exonuclease-like 3'-5' exonuclease
MEGSAVWGAYQEGRIAEIRRYCEADVANTWLVYLRFQLMRGRLDDRAYRAECDLVRTTLARGGEPHWREFLERWPQPAA